MPDSDLRYDDAIRERLRRYVEDSPDAAVRAAAEGDPLTLVNFAAHKLDETLAGVERLREIERAFNEGWLPPLPGEGPSLRLEALHRLRELIPDA